MGFAITKKKCPKCDCWFSAIDDRVNYCRDCYLIELEPFEEPEVVFMRNRLSVGELFDILEAEIILLMDENDSNEHIGKIKAASLLLEERFREFYRRANSNRRK